MELYQRDLENQEIGVRKGHIESQVEWQELLAGAIHEIKLGKTKEALLKSGFDEQTIDIALKCLE